MRVCVCVCERAKERKRERERERRYIDRVGSAISRTYRRMHVNIYIHIVTHTDTHRHIHRQTDTHDTHTHTHTHAHTHEQYAPTKRFQPTQLFFFSSIVGIFLFHKKSKGKKRGGKSSCSQLAFVNVCVVCRSTYSHFFFDKLL